MQTHNRNSALQKLVQAEIEKTIFDESVNCKGPWLMYAKQLMRSALDLEAGELDRNQFFRPRIKLMLVAFAFENLFKAAYIHNSGTMAKDGKVVGARVRSSHDLVQIALLASVAVTDQEKEALRALSLFGRFLGRYPAPMSWDEEGEIGDGPSFSMVSWSSTMDDLLSDLFLRTLEDVS
jgi:hypothetical protein